jgi:hypothetical protein
LGDIKKLLDKGDFGDDAKAQGFLEDVKDLFKDAIFLYNQHSALTSEEFRSGRKDIIKRFRKLYQYPPLSHHESDNIRKRLITFKNELFVFLKYPETINPTNNFAEQNIRNAVLFRKITFGNMTKNGKNNVAIAMTIIRTALLRALDPIKIMQGITANGVTPELLKQFGLPPTMAQAP